LAKLKQKSRNERTLPRGILTDAARASGCTPSFMRYYLDKSASKKNSDMWNQFVEENFDSMVTEAMTIVSNEPAEEIQSQMETHLHNEYRTCTLSMKKVIRSDLSPSLKNTIDQKLRDIMSKASDYAANISEVVYMMTVTFKSHCFAIENNEMVLDKRSTSKSRKSFQKASLMTTLMFRHQLQPCLWL
ncbi:hypothetical protein BCV72DRAFT_317482, partial [Rhizopus microsporus var. microsporus]